MKKHLLLLSGILAILSFISCGSTPTAEPETKKEPPKVEEAASAPVVEEPAAEDFAQANEVLLSKADAARQKAIEAGAEKYFPDVLAADDGFYDGVKSDVKENPSADHSAKIKDVIERYNALATACAAKEMQEKANELGLSDADAEKAFIVQAGPFMGMTGIRKADIVWTTFERAVVADRHLSEGFPALERVLREFEGAVLHKLGVQAAVGRKVDVLEENAVHGGLDGGADLLDVDVHPVRLGGCGQAEKKGRCCQKNAVADHHNVVRFFF